MASGSFPKGHLLALGIWIVLFALLFLVFDTWLNPTAPTVTIGNPDSKEIAIPRSRDGHYYLKGSINGKPLVFVVDTGATSVSVSSAFARAARLGRGDPAKLVTAGGVIDGETVSDLTVEAGGIRISHLNVSVGLDMDRSDLALLGQNFLRRLEVIQVDDKMVLRVKK